MTLLHPTALILLLLALPVAVLVLWRARARRRQVAAGFLWQQAAAAASPLRLRWNRWRRPVTLLLELAILGLLVLAAADPRIPPPRATVLVLDTSASMAATDVAPSRMEAAKTSARGYLASLPDGSSVALLTAGADLAVRCRLTDDRAAVGSALDAVSDPHGSTRLAEAVALAQRLLADQPDGHVVVFSDGNLSTSGSGTGTHSGTGVSPVEVVPIGTPVADNVAVSRLAARRAVADPRRLEVFVELRSFTDAPVRGRLTLSIEGSPPEATEVELDAGGRWQHVFEQTTADAGRVTATWHRPDALAADNVATCPFRAAATTRLVLLGPDDPHLQEVLGSLPLVELSTAERPPQASLPGHVTVLHREVPARLPPGPLLVIAPAGPCNLWTLGEPIEDSEVARQETGSPLTADLSLSGTWFGPTPRIVPVDGANTRPLAWTADDTPVLFAIERPDGRVVVLLSDLDRGELARQPGFAILMANALDWLTGGPAAFTPATPAAELSESDLRLPNRTAEEPTPAAATSAPLRPLWILLAAAAALLLAVEWAAYQRRWVF